MTTIVRRDRRRFTVEVDGAVAGHAYFEDADGRRTFTHTEIDDAFGGRGLGGVLVLGALDATRQERLRIVPVCPYVKHWLETHHEFDDLVDDASA